MQTIEISKITIGERQRKERPNGHIPNLKKSILSKGLLHAPVLTSDHSLVAGECRIAAMQELHEDSLAFTFDRQVVPKGHVPFSYISDLSPADLAEAELEENIFRANLGWMEENQAYALIHRLRQTTNPKQTFAQTALEVLELKGEDPEDTTKRAREQERIRKAVLIDSHKDDPRVKAAKSTNDAVTIILDTAQKKLRRQMLTSGMVQSDHVVLHGDCRTILPTLQPSSFDTILCDPPYGIDINKAKKTEKHHYDDSAENALDLCKTILVQGWRLLKPKGCVFIFCDIDHFLTLREAAEMQAYTVWSVPLIWDKGNVGHAPWGKGGFIHTYECILYCVKGQKALTLPGGPDLLKGFPRVARNEKVHAAEKPVELLKHLLKISTFPGEKVLDPCCGSGSILDAASALAITATAIEIDDVYHAEACARLTKEIPIEDERDELEKFEEGLLK